MAIGEAYLRGAQYEAAALQFESVAERRQDTLGRGVADLSSARAYLLDERPLLARPKARRVFQEAAPHATASGYVNFLTEDEAERVEGSYGANYARLQTAKRKYDPDNLFRMNLNISPASA